MNMDDDSAEIELLEQNLSKTHQISQKMTTILNSFDTRLARLEKSILPLYNSTQILNRRASNIEKALMKIDEVASNQEGIAAEEALILRGPQPGEFEVYKDALQRLNASIAFKASDQDTFDTARLIETGAKNLAQLYTKLVAEGSSGTTPAPGVEIVRAPFPSQLRSTLQPIVAFLRTLPVPSTHPSHPAAAAILTTLKEAQRGYADMRGTWGKKCLEAHGKRVVDRADTMEPIATGKELGTWVQSVLSVAREEYDLLTEMSTLASPSQLASHFGNLLNPLALLMSSIITSLVAFSKRSLQKYGFLILSAYEALLELQPMWDEIAVLRVSPDNRKETNEYKDVLQVVRMVCIRMFPEALADIKLSTAGRTGDTSTALLDASVEVVQFLNNMQEVLVGSGDILSVVGDGNWKMGEGVVVKKQAIVEVSAQTLLEHFIYDVVLTIINTVSLIARTQRRPPFDSFFLLNNIAYLRKNILEPRQDSLIDYLTKPTQDVLNSNFRTAKASYLDANFSPLMQSLSDDPKEKGKAATKEKFTRFYDLLEEVLERHRLAKILEDDAESREAIGNDVIKFLIPSLKAFTQKQKEKEFSKNPQKYIKLSAETVESQLRSIYR
ncbi:Cullin repeat-like-containing domain protein [Lentinula aff. detonsa]|uniref:Exocyst complex protein EXO70 n=1 Tax=Lentinula aff. detonsa TaxID=2804958 RepID=A0AA38KPS0_9AGAR|nr:Cullin repeat-like-containing domain protein [Lentinula aff. detonsa]